MRPGHRTSLAHLEACTPWHLQRVTQLAVLGGMVVALAGVAAPRVLHAVVAPPESMAIPVVQISISP